MGQQPMVNRLKKKTEYFIDTDPGYGKGRGSKLNCPVKNNIKGFLRWPHFIT
jgi:hypothetical protein